MTELIRKKLNDSPIARWTAMFIVSFTMMCGYFITDVMASLEVMCTTPVADGGLGWSSSEYGFFSGAYGYINVFLLMLFFGGIILDKCGIRFTGVMSSSLMLGGALLNGMLWQPISAMLHLWAITFKSFWPVWGLPFSVWAPKLRELQYQRSSSSGLPAMKLRWLWGCR